MSEHDLPKKKTGKKDSANQESHFSVPESQLAGALPIAKNQKFEVKRIHRSELKNADYNPRAIDDNAKRKLRNQMRLNGLISAITWNKRTGNIVGGHQRISIMDSLEGTADYYLDVCVVDLPPKKEMEANVALNNLESQGVFDLSKLSTMFKDHKLEAEATGLDVSDLFHMFGENPAAIGGANIEKLAEKLQKTREVHEQVKDILAGAKDPNYYAVLVFPDYLYRLRFTEALGLRNNRYIDGKMIAEKLEIDLSIPCEAELSEPEDDSDLDDSEEPGDDPDVEEGFGGRNGDAD